MENTATLTDSMFGTGAKVAKKAAPRKHCALPKIALAKEKAKHRKHGNADRPHV
jgi:hypothetical protein